MLGRLFVGSSSAVVRQFVGCRPYNCRLSVGGVWNKGRAGGGCAGALGGCRLGWGPGQPGLRVMAWGKEKPQGRNRPWGEMCCWCDIGYMVRPG